MSTPIADVETLSAVTRAYPNLFGDVVRFSDEQMAMIESARDLSVAGRVPRLADLVDDYGRERPGKAEALKAIELDAASRAELSARLQANPIRIDPQLLADLSGDVAAMRAHAQRDPRLSDGEMAMGSAHQSKKWLGLFQTHFAVLSSPQFWSTKEAQRNADNFGTMMFVIVSERIRRQGYISAADLGDLNRALRPCEPPESVDLSFDDRKFTTAVSLEDLPDSLLGGLTDEKVALICDTYRDRYFGDTAPYAFNTGIEAINQLDANSKGKSGLEALGLLQATLTSAIDRNGLHAKALSDALAAIQV